METIDVNEVLKALYTRRLKAQEAVGLKIKNATKSCRETGASELVIRHEFKAFLDEIRACVSSEIKNVL